MHDQVYYPHQARGPNTRTTAPAPLRPDHATLIALQRSAGNAAVAQRFKLTPADEDTGGATQKARAKYSGFGATSNWGYIKWFDAQGTAKTKARQSNTTGHSEEHLITLVESEGVDTKTAAPTQLPRIDHLYTERAPCDPDTAERDRRSRPPGNCSDLLTTKLNAETTVFYSVNHKDPGAHQVLMGKQSSDYIRLVLEGKQRPTKYTAQPIYGFLYHRFGGRRPAATGSVTEDWMKQAYQTANYYTERTHVRPTRKFLTHEIFQNGHRAYVRLRETVTDPSQLAAQITLVGQEMRNEIDGLTRHAPTRSTVPGPAPAAPSAAMDQLSDEDLYAALDGLESSHGAGTTSTHPMPIGPAVPAAPTPGTGNATGGTGPGQAPVPDLPGFGGMSDQDWAALHLAAMESITGQSHDQSGSGS